MTSSGIPQDVANILDSLEDGDKQIVLDYITSLRPKTEEAEAEAEPDIPAQPDIPAESDIPVEASTSDEYKPTYFDPTAGSEDFDAAADFKQQAADAKSIGDWPAALEFYNRAVSAAPPSALLYANRAMVLIHEGHYKAAETDCNMALELNPDSAKALKVRGKLRHEHLDDWQGALSDLSQAQSIDFDPDVADTLKELSKLRVQEEKKEAKGRNDKEEKLRKRADEIKRAQEQAKEEEMGSAQNDAPDMAGMGGMPDMAGMGGMPDMAGMGGMPDMAGMGGMPDVAGMGGTGGMPGGMDGMPGMGGIMEMLKNDPELAEAMKNPKIVAAFSDLMSGPGGPMGLMSNPGKMAQLMSDPDVGPILQKIMSKMMGGMGGGGMPGMPGMPGQQPDFGANDDDVPDLGDVPELD